MRQQALDQLLSAWLQLAMLADAKLPAEPYFPPGSSATPPAVVPAERAEQLTADPISWFTTERTSLLAAVEHACAAGQLDLARRLAAYQRAFQHLQYRQGDAEKLWRTIPASTGRFSDKVFVGATRRVLSPEFFDSLMPFQILGPCPFIPWRRNRARHL